MNYLTPQRHSLVFSSFAILVILAACKGQTPDITKAAAPAQKPNILWVITDDHRPDSVQAYNRAVYGTDHSPLGYVESPNVDKLANEGILFTQAFTNSPVCAPSRAAMHSGRYPFRSGRYAFEHSHNATDFSKPLVSEHLSQAGYGTAMFGKEDHYFFEWGENKYAKLPLFDFRVHFKHNMQHKGIGDLFYKVAYGDNIAPGTIEVVNYPDGRQRSYYLDRKGKPLTNNDMAEQAATDREFDILRSYTRGTNKTLILGGENPMPADKTIDALIVQEMEKYLANDSTSYQTIEGLTATGADPSKPLFINLGFHLPHTPVLPPKAIRERFRKQHYQIPSFDEAELAKMPTQLKKLYHAVKATGMTDSEMQQAVQDYYAFTAHGDALFGEAVEAFKAYSNKHKQPWIIVYTIGDHGWHLGENGIEAKFGPWQQSVGNAVVMAASNPTLLPKGSINDDLVEFVDFAPTLLDAAGIDTQGKDFDYLDGQSLFDIANGDAVKRDYILGEINVISGHRAYLHGKRFRFSMRTRPYYGNIPKDRIGQNLEWALTAKAEDVDMALYDLKHDPLERNNLAYHEDYQALAHWFRQKLGNIVLGDGRIEVDWNQKNHFVYSDFAKGADDKQLDIPRGLIPR